MTTARVRATVDGVVIARDDESLTPEELRQRACTELLRQKAMRAGLLAADDPAPIDGVISEAASAAIEGLLDQALVVPEPDDTECRRHHAAHAARYVTGERAQVRHILFAVTAGVDVNALRQRAEACLIDLRAAGHEQHDSFAAAAGKLSNCPSGADGGNLGWLEARDCAPEFAHEVFGRPEIGVLPRLVTTRYGMHVVEVLTRTPGEQRPFETVRSAVAASLRRQAFTTTLRQYLIQLAAHANVEGVDLDRAELPLVQ